MATLGDLVVNIVGNTRRLGSDLNKGSGMLGSFASGAVRTLAPVAAALGAAFGARSTLRSAQTQIAAERKLQGVLEATGGAAGLSAQQIAEYASELQSVTNFGDEATIAAAGVLATFKDIKGDNFKTTLALAQDLAATLGGDLKAATLQLGKALNNPAKGYSALAEAGVSFTEQQIEQIKALQASGDLLGAQEIILKELQSEVGGVARNMADPLTQAMGVVGDLAENFGFMLLPAVNAVSGAVRGLLGPATGARATFEAIGQRIGAVVQSVIDFLRANQQTIATIGKFIAIAGGAAAAIVGITTVATTAGPVLGAAFMVAMGPVGLITAAVVGLGAAIVQATGEGETFGEKISNTFSQIPDLIDGAMFTFRNFSAIAQIALIDIVQKALEIFPQMEEPIERIAATFVGVWSGIKAFFNSFVQNVVAGLQEIGNFIKALAEGAKAAFSAITSGDFAGAAGAFGDAFIKELASQQDVATGGNPFEAFGDAFTEASEETRKMFEREGGLSAVLAKQKQDLLDGIGAAEQQRQDALNTLDTGGSGVPEESGASADDTGQSATTGKQPEFRAAEAIDARSREAFDAITKATSGRTAQDPQKQTVALQKEQLKKTDEVVTKLDQIKLNTGKKPKVLPAVA